MPLANFADSIPFVTSDADRTARFPAPPKNFRVQYPDGTFKKYVGGGVWQAFGATSQSLAKLSSQFLVGDSVANDRAALDTLVNVTMQPDGGEIDVVGVPRIASDLTIPKNIQLNFRNGAYLAPDLGVTVTILGKVSEVKAKIFGGGGAFSLTRGHGWQAANFGCDPDTTAALNTTGFQKAVNSLVNGGRLEFGLGRYLFNDTVANLDVNSLTIFGQGGFSATGVHATVLDFSAVPTGKWGITITGSNPANTLKRPKIRDLYIEMLAPAGQIGGGAVRVQNASLCEFDCDINVQRGATSYGLLLGDPALIADAVIAGEIKGLYVCNGTPVFGGVGCTSLDFKTYTLGMATAGIWLKGATYCHLHSCASDSGAAGSYAYRIDGCTAIDLASCGAEGIGRARLHITGGSTGITDTNGRAVNCNADGVVGPSYAWIDATGTHYGVSFINPTDTGPNAATDFSIKGAAGNGWTTIIGGGDGVSLPKGVGGDAAWLGMFVTIMAGSHLQVPVMAPAYVAGSEADLIAGIDARKGGGRYVITFNRVVGAPVNPRLNQRMVFTIIQDATGGFTLGWNAVFKVTWSNVGNAANKRSSVEFQYDGVNWNQIGAQTPYV